MQSIHSKMGSKADSSVIILAIGLMQENDDYIAGIIDFVQERSDSDLVFIYCNNIDEISRLAIQEYVDVILLNLSKKNADKFDLVELVNQQIPHAPIIALTNLDDNLMQLNLQHDAVQDYFAIEYLDSNFLIHAIHRAIKRQISQNLHKQADVPLEERHQYLSSILHQTIDGLLIVDEKNFIRFTNPAAGKLLNSSNASLIGQPFIKPVSSKSYFELKIDNSNGKFKTIEARVVKTSWEGARAYLVILRDITRRKKQQALVRKKQARVQQMAYFDKLTQLPNRQLLEDRILQTLAQSHRDNKQFALLFLDLDGFKDVNDTFGHAAGDSLLKMVAKRLEKCVRASDTVARFGGDEFIILMQDIAKFEDTAGVSQNILTQLNRPFELQKQYVTLSTSIGISLFPIDGTDMHTLLKKADAAMYQAKKNSKGTFNFFNQGLQKNNLARVTVAHNYKKAYQNREFVIYYQPQIDCRNNRITGIQALLRWQHPELGLLEPERFLSQHNHNNFNKKLGFWVLRQACNQIKNWQLHYHYKLLLTVNLSHYLLRDKLLLQRMDAILAKIGIAPEFLNLEIDGTQLQLTRKTIRYHLRQLHDRGIHLTYLGFGKEQCSIPHILDLPFDIFKVDAQTTAFIKHKTGLQKAFAGLINIVHQSGKKIIACGVQSSEDITLLRELGCDTLQGLGCCEPLPCASIPLYFQNRRQQIRNKIKSSPTDMNHNWAPPVLIRRHTRKTARQKNS